MFGLQQRHENNNRIGRQETPTRKHQKKMENEQAEVWQSFQIPNLRNFMANHLKEQTKAKITTMLTRPCHCQYIHHRTFSVHRNRTCKRYGNSSTSSLFLCTIHTILTSRNIMKATSVEPTYIVHCENNVFGSIKDGWNTTRNTFSFNREEYSFADFFVMVGGTPATQLSNSPTLTE